MTLTTSKSKLTLLATGIVVLALFLLPSVTAAAYSSPMKTYATFKVVNSHGIIQSGVKSLLEINDHRYSAYTNSKGIVSFNLAGYASSTKLQVDFEKGSLGYTLFSTVASDGQDDHNCHTLV